MGVTHPIPNPPIATPNWEFDIPNWELDTPSETQI